MFDITDGYAIKMKYFISPQCELIKTESVENEFPWLTDRGRFFYEEVVNTYADGGYMSAVFDKNLFKTSWNSFLESVSNRHHFLCLQNLVKRGSLKLKPFSASCLIFKRLNIEELCMLKLFINSTEHFKAFVLTESAAKSNLLSEENKYVFKVDLEKFQLDITTLVFLIGINIKAEGYVFNLKMRQRFRRKKFSIMSFGPAIKLSLPLLYLGSTFKNLVLLTEGASVLCQNLSDNKSPLILSSTSNLKSSVYHKTIETLSTFLTTKSNFGQRRENNTGWLSSTIESVGLFSIGTFPCFSNRNLIETSQMYLLNINLNEANFFTRLNNASLLSNDPNFCKNFTATDLTSTYEKNLKNLNLFHFSKPLSKNDDARTFMYDYLPTKTFLETNATFFNTQGIIKRSKPVLKSYKTKPKVGWDAVRLLNKATNNAGFISLKEQRLSSFFKNYDSFRCYVWFNFMATKSMTSNNFKVVESFSPLFLKNKSFFKKLRLKYFNTYFKYFQENLYLIEHNDNLNKKNTTLKKSSSLWKAKHTNFF